MIFNGGATFHAASFKCFYTEFGENATCLSMFHAAYPYAITSKCITLLIIEELRKKIDEIKYIKSTKINVSLYL